MSSDRKLAFNLAINEALHQSMEFDPSVFVMGQGVTSPWYVGNTARDLMNRFGSERVIDSPISENGIAGAAIGAAIVGMKARTLWHCIISIFSLRIKKYILTE